MASTVGLVNARKRPADGAIIGADTFYMFEKIGLSGLSCRPKHAAHFPVRCNHER